MSATRITQSSSLIETERPDIKLNRLMCFNAHLLTEMEHLITHTEHWCLTITQQFS